MTNSPNPHYISQNANGSSMTQPVDSVDFPHSGLIKALNQMAAGNVVVKTGTDFDTNQTGGNLVVAAGKILRNGKYIEVSTKTFADSSLTTTYAKGYHLLVVADGREGGENANELYLRPPTANERVPEFKLGDTIVAMIEYSSGTSAGSRLIQYFTTNKESNSLSIAYANSNVYTQAMTVDADSDGDVTFENVVTDKDIIFKVSDGGTPTEVMRIDGENSKVGIGTNSPDSLLHVAGTGIPTIKLQDTDTAGGFGHLEVNGAALFIESYDEDGTEGQILFKNATTEAMRIKEDGKVGIGTSTPSTKVEIKGDTTISRSVDSGQTRTLSIEGARNATGTDYARIDFKNHDSNGPTSYTGARISAINEDDGVNDGSLIFSTNNANAGITERMRINDAGNVGIGTDSPETTLHLKSSATLQPRLLIENTNTDDEEPMLILRKNSATPNALTNPASFTDATCDTNHTTGLSDGASTSVRHITHNANANIVVGLTVSGTGIPSGATIVAINNSTCFTLSADTTATNTNTTLTFVSAEVDDLGIIRFEGEDSTGANTLYAHILAEARGVTNTQEAGKIGFNCQHQGTSRRLFLIQGNTTAGATVMVNDGQQDCDFVVEGVGNAHLLRTDAANDRVAIGHNSPTATLDMLTGGTFRNTRLLTVSVSASTTLTESAHAGRYNICAGNITLPSTSTAGEHYAILNTTGGDITIGRNGNNINGAGSDVTLGSFKAATCIAIGSNNWMVVGV
tara:strand:- start:19151 stop:21373 length:2223 start_codon:yes stop_codon:yes gene_type:complete